jgi:hypothetical protein
MFATRRKPAMLSQLSAFVAASCCCTAFGQIVADGVADSAYPPPASLQACTTGFGDSQDSLCDRSDGGSELCNLRATVSGGVLYIFFGGNLESTFNKFDLFIDAKQGGQNTLRTDNPDVDFNGLNRMGGNPGLTFDQCFTADFYVTATNGGEPLAMYASVAYLPTLGGGAGQYLGQGVPCATPILGKSGVIVAMNNSNAAGVGGDGGDTSGAAAVDTGIEIAIPLTLLGYDASVQQNIRFVAFVNSGDHGYASNQFLGSLPAGSANLGETRNINLANIKGNQYASLIVNPDEPVCPPEPPACNADVNGDGVVNATDLTIVLGGWGVCP